MKTNKIELRKKFSDSYIIYSRKSTDDAENQKNSIAYQLFENEKFSKKENLKIASLSIDGFCNHGIIEEHHSGFKEDDGFEVNENGTITYKVLRPKFLTLVNYLKAKEFKGVICLCWDRFSRNESDDVLIKKLINQGVDVRFVQASYEDTSSGALHMDIDGMFSRHYSRVISEKVKTSNKKLRNEGRCIYAAPIGYLNNGSDNKPFDQKRAPIIKQIFELYATGQWSFASLAKWSNKEGLKTKPMRRKRTKEEKARGVELEKIPKVAKAITSKTIENILSNPFYIGKNIANGVMIDSKAHQALIETNLFYKVQSTLKSKTVSAHYPDSTFFTYRGLLKCAECERAYSPYQQKGIIYYRPKCKEGCVNNLKNVNDKYITDKIYEVLSRISFSEEELTEIEVTANAQINKIAGRRNQEMESLYRQLAKIMADYDYLIKDKLNLLRTGVFTHEEIKSEEGRLNLLIEEIKNKISANSESTKAMLDYVITFSELIKNAANYFKYALDSEKHELVLQVFSELSFKNGELKYVAKDGFNMLLKRFDAKFAPSGSPHYVFSELQNIYSHVKTSLVRFQTINLTYK